MEDEEQTNSSSKNLNTEQWGKTARVDATAAKPLTRQHGQPRSRDRIAVTPDMSDALKAERARTGIGPTPLVCFMAARRESVMVTPYRIYNWLAGTAKSVFKDEYDAVLAAWRALPTMPPAASVERPVEVGRIALTRHMRAELKAELARTAIGPGPLVRFMAAKRQSLAVTSKVIHMWIAGKVKSVAKDEYDAVLAAWRALPDSPVGTTAAKPLRRGPGAPLPTGRIPLTPDMSAALKAERARTGIGSTRLVRLIALEDEGLVVPPHTISSWLGGAAKSIAKDEYDAVLAAWRALPTKNSCFKTPEDA